MDLTRRIIICCAFCILIASFVHAEAYLIDGGQPFDLQLTSPPNIVKQPEKEVAYTVPQKETTEHITLPCEAQGDPQPTYEWFKDGQPLDLEGLDILKRPGTGTIVITLPKLEHEGIYQCEAKNEFGIALSVKSMVKQAVIFAFPRSPQVKIHKPIVGNPLTLSCNPRYSYPTAEMDWTFGPEHKVVIKSKRVSLDYEGNLHFANVKPEDKVHSEVYYCTLFNRIYRGLFFGEDQQIEPRKLAGGLHFANVETDDGKYGYVCTGHNTFLRIIVQGDDQRIQPKQISATPNYRAPELMWNSPTPTVVLQEGTQRIKCIFSGYPTPDVTWEKLDGQLPDKTSTSSFGQELKIPNAELSDGGTYRCSAINKNGGTPITKDIFVNVEARPKWVVEPEDVNTSEEEGAVFTCQARGRPTPFVEWYINGVPLSEAPPNPRRTLSADKSRVEYTNLAKSDAQVLQCNATNKHGYIFANAYLNVLAEPPSFLDPPTTVKVAEGQSVNLTCRVFGAPKPVITWFFKNETTPIDGNRFKIQKYGDLEIRNALPRDQGLYRCHARNKFGEEEMGGKLFVREKTEIVIPPQSQTVNASTDVVFNCEAKTDPLERSRLKISWLRNGDEISYEKEGRVSKNTLDKSLRITQATVGDTARYTCVASNGIDTAEYTATLTVKDRPDPPFNIELKGCGSTSARVSWTPGSENNDEVLEFIVYYNTSFDTPMEFHEGATTAKGSTLARVPLSAWANYTFHVRARNSVGLSDKSFYTKGECKAPSTRPAKNPSNVCTESRDPNQLVITWNPMPQIDHDGEGFYYVVSYQRRDIPDGRMEVHKEYNWRKGEYVVYNQETFKEYEISVQAANDLGYSVARNRVKIGYSGEDYPMDGPDSFAVNDDSINATSAEFSWYPVDDNPERIRGHFHGYRIVFWKDSKPEEKRHHDVIINELKPCPPLQKKRRGRGRRQSDIVVGHVMNLWPYSHLSAAVSVKNGAKTGPMSNVIGFSTPEGYPGKVGMFRVIERGSHHFKVEWEPPLAINGVLKGYTLSYRELGQVQVEKELPMKSPLKRRAKIHDLNDQTEYVLYIRAHTGAGAGEVYFLNDQTIESSVPDTPGIGVITSGEDFLEVSWTPSDGVIKNPGQKFYVEYKKADDPDATWIQTDKEHEHNWINVTGLENGVLYDIRIVAVNGIGEESRSKPTQVRVGETRGAIVQDVAKAGWFIGIMCAIIFLIIILVIVCLIKRNRGGKYPVAEKEKLRHKDPDKDDEEAGFGEYTRPEPPLNKKSTGSLNSSEKPLESETDSLAEYEQMDPTKFNEDGSFIGQYGGEEKIKEKEPDATSPSALSTFV